MASQRLQTVRVLRTGWGLPIMQAVSVYIPPAYESHFLFNDDSLRGLRQSYHTNTASIIGVYKLNNAGAGARPGPLIVSKMPSHIANWIAMLQFITLVHLSCQDDEESESEDDQESEEEKRCKSKASNPKKKNSGATKSSKGKGKKGTSKEKKKNTKKVKKDKKKETQAEKKKREAKEADAQKKKEEREKRAQEKKEEREKQGGARKVGCQ